MAISKDMKIGLSNLDKTNMADDIYNRVIAQVENITIAGVRDSIEVLRSEFPDGTAGIWVTTDNGYWNYFNTIDKVWVAGGLFIDEQDVAHLEADKVNKDMVDWGTMPETITNKNTFYHEVSKVFATANHSIYMFGTPEELQRVWDIWTKPEGLKATHVYIAIKPISNKSSRNSFIMWVFASNYATPYFRIIGGYNGSYVGANDKGWVDVNKLATSVSFDVFDLFSMIENPYPNEMVIDVNETNDKIEQHLDRNYEQSLDKEVILTVARPNPSKQLWTLAQEEVNALKGLRAWIEFSYNGNLLVQCQELRFPQVPTNAEFIIGTPIPNPQVFSEKIVAQYGKDTGELKMISTGGSISADIKIIAVRGIK